MNLPLKRKISRTPPKKNIDGYGSLTFEQILELPADEKLLAERGYPNLKDALLDDIQSNILKANKHEFTLFCFLTFEDGKEHAISDWLGKMPITSALDQQCQTASDNAISFSLSYEGYIYCCGEGGVSRDIPLDDDIIAFKEGLANRNSAAFGAQSQKYVEDNYERPAHALLFIATNDGRLGEWNLLSNRKKRDADLLGFFIEQTKGDTAFDPSFGKVTFEIGRNKREGSANGSDEWFGFRDGINNPRFFPDKDITEKLPFVPSPPSPLKVALRPNRLSPYPKAFGSFVVFLKLEQNVKAFDERVDELATKLGLAEDKERAAAYIMGRYRNGTPLHEDFDPSEETPGQDLDDFDFKNDPQGMRCPFHAHIRKANPRNGQAGKRIIRRGKIYGTERSKKKGILFLSYQANLLNFEDIINRGLYAYNAGLINTGQDGLFVKKGSYQAGHEYTNAAGKKTRPYLAPFKPLVKFRGGQYFFASSISFIRESLKYYMKKK